MKNTYLMLLAAACAFAVVGCGGSGETIAGTESNPRVRVLNLVSAPAQVDVSIDGELSADNTAFGSLGLYKIFRNGNRETIVRDATSQGVLAQQSNLFELSNYYTVAVVNGPAGVEIARVREDRDVPTNIGQIRVIHLGNGVGPVDLYITAPGANLTGVTPTKSNVSFGTSSTSIEPYLPFNPGDYQVRVTTAGTKTVLLTEDVTLTGSSSKTVYVTNNGTPDLLLVDDKQ